MVYYETNQQLRETIASQREALNGWEEDFNNMQASMQAEIDEHETTIAHFDGSIVGELLELVEDLEEDCDDYLEIIHGYDKQEDEYLAEIKELEEELDEYILVCENITEDYWMFPKNLYSCHAIVEIPL